MATRTARVSRNESHPDGEPRGLYGALQRKGSATGGGAQPGNGRDERAPLEELFGVHTHARQTHRRNRDLRAHHGHLRACQHRRAARHDARLGRQGVHREAARCQAVFEGQVPFTLETGGLIAMRWFRLCAALLAALALASAQSPTGKWVAKFSSDDEAREIVLALNVESGSTLTGYVLAPQYEDRIVEGTASGGQITFVAEREANNNTMRRSNYSAVLEGDKLKLTMPPAGNRPPQVIEFTRASAQAPAPLPPDRKSTRLNSSHAN